MMYLSNTLIMLTRYTTLCQWPERAHDHFRDVLYHSPLAHAASQLMNNAAVRVLNTIVMGSTNDNIIPLRWHADYGTFPGPGQCDNGLIMWMPVLETSYPDTNGMMVATASHLDHGEFIRNGSWDRQQTSSMSGQVGLMRYWRHLGEQCDTFSPTLELGDVLVINKVILSSSSFIFILTN